MPSTDIIILTSPTEIVLGTSVVVGGGGSPGTLDHGVLIGLNDDDHPHYLTTARGDVRYAGINYKHSELSELNNDDHNQYYNQSRGDARYSQLAHTHIAASISDSTSVGRSVITAVDAAAARSAISAQVSGSYAAASHTHAWADITSGVPSTFTPSAHTHVATDISDSTATGRSVLISVDAAAARTAISAQVAGSYASTSHVHAGADITTGTVDPTRLGSGSSITTKFLRGDSTWQTISGGGDALVSNNLDQFADVTQTAGQTLAITSSTTLSGGTHSGTNTGDNAVNSLYSGLVSNANHTGDATGSTALTLATVNSNVGSFGSATQATQVTVNAKGLVTSAANVTVTPAVGSITGLGTGVASALSVNVGSVGAALVSGGVLGTPTSGVATNLTGTAAGLTAGNVTTNANLTGHVTSVGNAAVLGSFTKSQLDAAVSDGNVLYVGDAPTAHVHAWADITSGVPSTFTPSAHTHTAANITDFAEAVDDRVAALLVQGSNVTLTYNDPSNTITIAATGGSGGSGVSAAFAIAMAVAL